MADSSRVPGESKSNLGFASAPAFGRNQDYPLRGIPFTVSSDRQVEVLRLSRRADLRDLPIDKQHRQTQKSSGWFADFDGCQMILSLPGFLNSAKNSRLPLWSRETRQLIAIPKPTKRSNTPSALKTLFKRAMATSTIPMPSYFFFLPRGSVRPDERSVPGRIDGHDTRAS